MNYINRIIDSTCGSELNRHQHVDNLDTPSFCTNQGFSGRNDLTASESKLNGTPRNYTQVAVGDYELIQRKKEEEYSFGSQFALSCFAIIFCGVIFGAIGCILSVYANRSALYYNKLEKARRLGLASYVFSLIGVLLGTAMVAALVMYYAFSTNAALLNPNCWSANKVYTC